MDSGQLKRSWHPMKLTALASLLLWLTLSAMSACAPETPTPPPPVPKTPSKVITEGGIEFFVYGLKLPGTSQELKLKTGGSTTWVPLSIISYIRFSGCATEQYRQAEIGLTSGERLHGDLFVNTLIEGTTDLGYWNIRLAKVRQLMLGEE
jgi:hypothetical protein